MGLSRNKMVHEIIYSYFEETGGVGIFGWCYYAIKLLWLRFTKLEINAICDLCLSSSFFLL